MPPTEIDTSQMSFSDYHNYFRGAGNGNPDRIIHVSLWIAEI